MVASIRELSPKEKGSREHCGSLSYLPGPFGGEETNSRELTYQNPTKDLIAVPVASGADFQPGKPVTLFHADITQFGWSVHRWAVTSDGQRFLVNQALKNPLRGITVTTNWQSAIAER